MTTFQTFKTALFEQAKAKGFADYELFFIAGDGFSVRVFDGEVSEYKNTSTESVGFRGTYSNGKMGYAYSERVDVSVIEAMLTNAAQNASIIEDKEVEKLYPGDENYPKVDSYNPALNEVSAEQKIQWALEMEKYALGLDPRVKMADYCQISTNEANMAMGNSYGLDLSQKRNMASAFLIARVEENGVMKSASEYWAGRDFADFDYKKLAKTAVDAAVAQLGASPVASGEYQVILDQNTARDLFEVYAGIFVAEAAQKGFSLLNKDRVGEQIAAQCVTIRDDGVTELSLGSMSFDAEGVATQNKAVIENGVLKTMLYNTKSAAKDGVSSTGNASKSGVKGSIGTAHTNFYLVPGEQSQEELIAGMEKGLVITDLAGLHSGTNTISGDFSVSADGFLVENGKIVQPVEQITIAGNFYELLKNVAAVGSNLRFHSGGSGGMGMPSVLVDKLSVSGL